jgi:hypothetical protein
VSPDPEPESSRVRRRTPIEARRHSSWGNVRPGEVLPSGWVDLVAGVIGGVDHQQLWSRRVARHRRFDVVLDRHDAVEEIEPDEAHPPASHVGDYWRIDRDPQRRVRFRPTQEMSGRTAGPKPGWTGLGSTGSSSDPGHLRRSVARCAAPGSECNQDKADNDGGGAEPCDSSQSAGVRAYRRRLRIRLRASAGRRSSATGRGCSGSAAVRARVAPAIRAAVAERPDCYRAAARLRQYKRK